MGLASNLAGFLVLGGHGHSHGSEEHEHPHDEVRSAEEGHNHEHSGHSHDAEGHTAHEAIEYEGHPGEVFPEAVVAKMKSKSAQQLRFNTSDEISSPSKDTNGTPNRSQSRASSRKHQRRRTSSIRGGRFTSIDDISIHPASFRQDIIAASRPQLDGIESGDNTASEEEAIDDDEVNEGSALLPAAKGKQNGYGICANDDQIKATDRGRHESWHGGHRHNKPKKASKGGHSHNHADMGMNAMILHVIGDALGNIGVIVSALIIWLTTWSGRFYADPAVSLFITIIILKSTIPLTSATAKILLQATPDHIDVNDIKEDIQELPGVISCHHVHVWQLSDTQIVASMHIQCEFPISEAGGEKYMELAKAVRKCLHAYGIHSATIQPEFCLDKDHAHNIERPGAVGLDGIVGQARCGLDDDSCLLECVDDCVGKGCCSPKAVESQHDHSDHDEHSH